MTEPTPTVDPTVRALADRLGPLPSDAAVDRSIVRRGGFRAYARLAWAQVDASELVWAPYLDTICDALEELARLRYEVEGLDPDDAEALLAARSAAFAAALGVADLLSPLELALSVPPASGKSIFASILWQTWVWTWWPESRWISATFEKDLALDHSTAARDLVLSEWYQARWPLRVTRTAAGYWRNELGGWRRAVGTGGSITGKHAHFHLGDDLVKEQLARLGTASQIAEALGKATSFWFTTLGTRRTKQVVARVLIGQRLAVDDTPGVAIRDHGYRSIVLPARFEPERAHPLDRRTEAGELLAPGRMNEAGLRALERTIGPIAARAQLQQDPVPLGGRVIELAWTGHRYRDLPSDLRQAITTRRPGPWGQWGIFGDLNFKGKESSSRVALQVWAWLHAKAWCIDAVVAHTGFLGALDMIADLHARYPWVTTIGLEDAANAPAVVEALEEEIPGLLLIPHGGGTLARTQAVAGLWAAGDVLLPAEAEWLGGSQGFVAEHTGFDGLKTRPDDQVSASSLALCYFVGDEAEPEWARGADALREPMRRAPEPEPDDDEDDGAPPLGHVTDRPGDHVVDPRGAPTAPQRSERRWNLRGGRGPR